MSTAPDAPGTAHRLFVVVSTGQRVANLPPLLEHGQTGDRVVWVESAGARRACWSQGARALLARLGFTSLPDIKVDELDDLGELVRQSQPAVAAAREQGLRPHLILNGGKKLTPLGLLRAWGELNPVLLYGEDQPAVCKTYVGTLDQPPAIRPYDRHTLDLPEVLEVSGNQLFNNEGVRFWPGPLTDDLAREPYGLDEKYTVGLHSAHHLREGAGEESPLPSYKDVEQVAAEAVRSWKRGILRPLCKRGLELPETEDGVFELIYSRTRGLVRDGIQARRRASRTPIPPISDAFERAVARRVHAWLEAERHPAVHSAWRRVKVASRGDPGQERAEFDVLLVLNNGVLWHLECKSFAADLKDLDARLFNLQQAGSQLARMALCGPLLAGHTKEAWFPHQHGLREKIEARGYLTFVPFNLPGQPDKYWVNGTGVARECSCPTLEGMLERALDCYRPSSS